MDRNCGLCGCKSCEDFRLALVGGIKTTDDCPFWKGNKTVQNLNNLDYDFILHPFPDEPSTRKTILPFRPDITERLYVKKGDLILGRPAGAGCPVQHVLKVISADYVTGLMECHVVGPQESRLHHTYDIKAYHIHAFEGIAEPVNSEPEFGKRQRFLPSFCMMDLVHTAVVSMVLGKTHGTHVRLEDVRII
jgi:uncharacterized Fe-S cluster-containing protein